ncbi:MAG: hypothetical protein IKU70_13545 [Clostridia bacterium]|nr:hypothetical protein [Clostridia bacterium]
MSSTLAPVLRDYLVRYQQMAIRQTGRRPVARLRTPMEDALLLPGCQKPGYVFWQPVEWKNNKAPVGKAEGFHQSIVDYVSMCQFYEICFELPVAASGSPLSFLHGRVFECYANTQSNPPSRVFEEAALYRREHPEWPLSFCMAATCDAGEPLLLMLRAEDGGAFVVRSMTDEKPVELKVGLERLLPQVRFVYDV